MYGYKQEIGPVALAKVKSVYLNAFQKPSGAAEKQLPLIGTRPRSFRRADLFSVEMAKLNV